MKRIFLLSSLFIFLLFSCEEDDFGNSIPESEIINQQDDISFQVANFGDAVTADFTGHVVDESGNGIFEAQITIGTSTTQTDANGVFIIQDASAFKHFAFLKVRKEGYIVGSRVLIPDVNTINDVQITLLEKNIVTTVQSGEASIATLGESSVSFTGAFIDENDNPYTGDVEVSMHYLKPNESATFEQMPGMLFAQNISNEARSLETYGMLAINLFSPNGDVLNIAEDAPATIEFPVDNTQMGIAPDVIPLWFFDENVGYWKEQGEAIKVGDKYIGEVTHFTWWNCDLPIDYIEACITIQDENGALGGVPIQIIRNETGQIIFDGLTNQDGNECGLFPANEEITLKVLGADDCSDEQTYEAQLGPYSADTLIVITIPVEAVNQTTLIGTVTNCDGIPLENGIGLLVNNNGQVTSIPFVVENGVLDYTFTYCTQTTYEFIIIDQDQNENTGLLPISITAEVTNVGDVSICEQEENTYVGDLYIDSQEDLDEFGANMYTEIIGNFNIQPFSGGNTDITNLNSLSSLKRVTGDFSIQSSPLLENLQGLEQLESVGNQFVLNNLESINTLELLQSLQSVGRLTIFSLDQLENLSGLESLTYMGGIHLSGNESLASLDALSNVQNETLEVLSIWHSPSLTSIEVFDQVTTIESNLILFVVESLLSLDGLHNITSANGVRITSCDSITSLQGLQGLESVIGTLRLEGNTLLESLDGLENLLFLDGGILIGGTLDYNGNPILSDFCGLSNLFINGTIMFYNNNSFLIQNNAYNPTEQDFLNGNCSE
ncbi:hypothetical protein GCM10011344_32560 [Dokdonia pacifica]|uniref:Carboxypeptidase regulatory-like domain-containing protein n=1 Tax=Dokdonia pacifica TaxID=1627892 RepID=A0A239BIJ7_9FLAO|nr:hypothetical protein [Dokdonia pacifica]GGG29180.1 hypothetical protein GCM10011344_32560 [Dokdonia pacifica]SNS07790.1 hypothetical protein SAMN06265376_106209 [Dokdonia pacifica]